jgi:mannitol 2-dehydrogenase
MIDFHPVAMTDAIHGETLADPAIRLVSLTVTEGGYYIDPASQCFDASHPTSSPMPVRTRRRRRSA